MRALDADPGLAAAAALGATLVAPWLVGVPWSVALTAGAAVAFTAMARGLSRAEDDDESAPHAEKLMVAGGLILLAASLALPHVATPRSWGAPLLAFCGAALAAPGLSLWLRRERDRREELEDLRARLARREGDVRLQADQIRRLDLLDRATGLLNRRAFGAELESALKESRFGSPMAFVLVELEKSRLGSESGGLSPEGQRLALAVQTAVRGSDRAGRWDEDLLAVLLRECVDARPALNRLKSGLEREIGEEGALRVAGIALRGGESEPSLESLERAASRALDASRELPAAHAPTIWPYEWTQESGAAPSEEGSAECEEEMALTPADQPPKV